MNATSITVASIKDAISNWDKVETMSLYKIASAIEMLYDNHGYDLADLSDEDRRELRSVLLAKLCAVYGEEPLKINDDDKTAVAALWGALTLDLGRVSMLVGHETRTKKIFEELFMSLDEVPLTWRLKGTKKSFTPDVDSLRELISGADSDRPVLFELRADTFWLFAEVPYHAGRISRELLVYSETPLEFRLDQNSRVSRSEHGLTLGGVHMRIPPQWNLVDNPAGAPDDFVLKMEQLIDGAYYDATILVNPVDGTFYIIESEEK